MKADDKEFEKFKSIRAAIIETSKFELFSYRIALEKIGLYNIIYVTCYDEIPELYQYEGIDLFIFGTTYDRENNTCLVKTIEKKYGEKKKIFIFSPFMSIEETKIDWFRTNEEIPLGFLTRLWYRNVNEIKEMFIKIIEYKLNIAT